MQSAPRIDIGTWPTPTRRLEQVSSSLGVEVWVKLEEECGTWGGNKVRKLEYILGRARRDGVRGFVGFGEGTSNWTSALAYHGARLGFEVEVHLSGNDVPESYRSLYRSCETTLVRTGSARASLEVIAARLRPERGGTRYLPLGGSGAEGDLGSVHAGEELAASIQSGEAPRPEKLFVATGTCGTAAGLGVGLAAAGVVVPIVCVRVTQRPYGTAALVRQRMRSLQTRLGLARTTRCPVVAERRYFGPGYALSNSASQEAAEMGAEDGLELDQTYAAKAFAVIRKVHGSPMYEEATARQRALIAAARTHEPGPYLFLHTSPGPPPMGGAAPDGTIPA